ncbi:MAG: methyltransferase domain-containing protein [Rhodospirillales bacterium]|nr:methyltransferase domain-containing protein [Rhodospirillales bacterium]MBO6787752.1 methyltransferase domain-containing protein [Rhodospirillales bacterium]
MPRLAAFEILQDVLRRKRALDDALGAGRAYGALDPAGKAFAAFLVRTVLRRLGQIDALIAHCVRDPLPRKARPVYDVLRVGIAQLLFSATADHAAVSTTVDLCRTVGQVPFAKLVNAVMRRLQREGAAMRDAQDVAGLNTPAWLMDSWVTAYGAETANAIARQHLETPPIDVTVKSDADAWAETLGGKRMFDATVRIADAGDVAALAGFDDGAWWVQDAAARLAVGVLGDVGGKRVYDLCAAPGGKTLDLAAAGADVTALDISEKRLVRLKENLTRTGLSAEVVASDVRTWQPPAPADIVVLDAPCSSTGTLRRHPDVQHLKSPEDVEKLGAVQGALLDASANMTATGGMLLYVTCSLQPEEGPDVIDAFLARTPAFRRAPIDTGDVCGFADAVTAAGDFRTLPSHFAADGGMDGFFAARLIRQDT